jgi:signal transduction histidine kinase
MPGGAIVVRARHSAADAQVVIEVQDDGTGIAADRLRDLLQRSIDRPHVTGLGLLLVRDVVAAHGGRMDVTSRTDSEQSGTTVRLTLPCR